VRGPRLLLVLLLLSAFTLMVLDVRTQPFGALRDGADVVLGPAQRAVGGAARSVGGLFDGGASQEEVRRLRDENARLRGDLVRAEADRRRAAELDRLLALKDAGTYTVVPAQVTGLGSAFGFERTVTIDAGSRDGVREGQTVVSGDGLVGRTTRVGPFTSTVLLLTDPGFTVGARLTREGTVGLATGDGSGLTYELVEGGRVEVGEALLTTGSQTFVPGVPIGRVTSVDPSPGLVSTAQVRPFVRVAALDLVGVVTSPPRGTPRVPIPPS
jgi:rod shape-determining protein MreC